MDPHLQFTTKTFNSQNEFEIALKEYCSSNNVTLRRRNSKTNKNLDSLAMFPYLYIRYECIHFGKPRQHTTDGSRPNQSTNHMGCTFCFEVKVQLQEMLLSFKGDICMKHTHSDSVEIYKNQAQNRRLEQQEVEYITDLIQVKLVFKKFMSYGFKYNYFSIS
jgi:hypothetical protein